NEGYLICVGAILARTGTQAYLSKELYEDGDNTNVEVHREDSEVFDEKTIASFENKPITIEHPEEFVNVGNYKNLAVGFVRDVRKENVNGDNFLVGNLFITDEKAIQEIEENGMKYLSCGYDCDIVEEDGKVFQKNIRGNHVALCFNPRAGNTQIVDNSPNELLKNSIVKVIECIDSIDKKNYEPRKLSAIKIMLAQIIK
ncbi:DUF2213 domain-containing protein, partial [Mycoplasmopsis pulmonis]|uniref:DUF2213 domain-containing protein n=1 Tax=Mycoplasmopsis pulmonis TaxID=2107 RepID=UPI002ACDBB55